MRLGQVFQSHSREAELVEAALSRLPEELRGRVHVWVEGSGRIHIVPRGLSRNRWWRVHRLVSELGGYWRSEPWPDQPYWAIPAGKALRLVENLGGDYYGGQK